eukprot:gene18881-biopygen5709
MDTDETNGQAVEEHHDPGTAPCIWYPRIVRRRTEEFHHTCLIDLPLLHDPGAAPCIWYDHSLRRCTEEDALVDLPLLHDPGAAPCIRDGHSLRPRTEE